MEGKGKNNLIVEKDKLRFTMERVFNAPKELVWKVYTDPTLIPKWWGRAGDTIVVDKMDVKLGGEWRYVNKTQDGQEFAFKGVYTQVNEPKVLGYTFIFEPIGGEGVEDVLYFEDIDGKTRLFSTTTAKNLQDLEGLISSGMEDGAVETWDQIEKVIEGMK